MANANDQQAAPAHATPPARPVDWAPFIETVTMFLRALTIKMVEKPSTPPVPYPPPAPPFPVPAVPLSRPGMTPPSAGPSPGILSTLPSGPTAAGPATAPAPDPNAADFVS